MGWIVYASFAAIAMAAADVFIKLAAGKVSNSLGVLIYGSCTFTMGLAWVLWQKIHGVTLHGQTSGLLAAIGVGISHELRSLSFLPPSGLEASWSPASLVFCSGTNQSRFVISLVSCSPAAAFI